jgi:hypothetical protein
MKQPSLMIDSVFFSNVENGQRWLTIGKWGRFSAKKQHCVLTDAMSVPSQSGKNVSLKERE